MGLISEEEVVLGGLEGNARLEFGSERLLIFLTGKRMILAHRAKIGRGSMTLSSLFGKLATGVDGVMKGGQELGKLAGMKPDEILGLDPGNFAIKYGDIVGLEVKKMDRGVSNIVLVEKDRKIVLSVSSIAVDGVKGLLEGLLGEKVSFRAT